jgi:glycosyltransferase involved in cell wall biosynthesis
MKIGYLMQAGVPNLREYPLTGPALHVKHVFEELVKQGHTLRLLAFFDRRIWKSDDLEHFESVIVPAMDRGVVRLFERGVRRVQFELHLPYAALFESVRFALACRQELRGSDLLYERMGWFGWGGGLAARWLNVPLILEVNGDYLDELAMQGMMPRGAQRWLSVCLMRRAAQTASFTVSAGTGLRARHIERWRVNPDRIAVIENGTDLVDLLAAEQLRAFAARSNRAEPLIIAHAGGFNPWQGVPVLIRAIRRAVSAGIALRVWLIGAGPELAQTQQLVRDLDLENQVAFTGQLPMREYATRLADAEVGISAYCGRAEFSGLKLLDYKAAGLAIIASGKDGQPAVIEPEHTGLIVPPCDEDALYRAIARLSADRELVRRMGRAARRQAEQTHSWKVTAQHLNDLFGRVVNAH